MRLRTSWLSSPAFWLSLATPLIMMATVFAAVEPAPDPTGRLAAWGALGVGIAAWVGIRLASRERALYGSAGEEEEVPGKADTARLSAARVDTYRDLFENATDIVFTTDLSGHFLAGNKAVQRLLGYTVDEAKSLTWEKLVAPYDMWKARQMYKRHAMGEKRISFELDAVTVSGRIKTFEIGSRPMFQRQELCGFHGIARDITSRKDMEKQLELARREAEKANEAKSTFLANMSHEIRTPINGMLGFLSLFAKTDLNPRQREYLVPVEESAKHLLRIINDILDLSKIEAGRFSIDSEIFRYRDVVSSAVALLRPLGEDKGLQVHVAFDSRIPELAVGDGTRIGQVVYNLVSNAIKFTDSGSVSIRSRVVETESSRLWLEVVIRDTGIGIAPESRRKLFEPFQQIDAKPDRRYAGTGLGLTISRNLVEAMGGGIDVRSEPGSYTEVSFTLPLGLAPAAPGDGADESIQSAARRFEGAGLSALIVDDNEINRWYLRAVLEQYGVSVAQAESGASALARCQAGRCALIFMDIHMADMDGIETARRIRAQVPACAGVPMVAVSADVVGDSGARFVRQGLEHFLAKPVSEDDLVRLLRRLFPDRVTGEGGRILDDSRALALASNNRDLWRRSLEALRQQLHEALPQFCAALARRDGETVHGLAHKLAGSAEYVAAEELANCARALEHAAAHGQDKVMSRRLHELERAARRLIDAPVPDA